LPALPVLKALFLTDVNPKVEQDKIPIDTYHMHRERGNSNASSDVCKWESCPGGEQDKIPIDTYHMHRERGSSNADSDGCEWGSAQVEQDKIPIDTYHMHRERRNSSAGVLYGEGCTVCTR
jgi:hypothetical protein